MLPHMASLPHISGPPCDGCLGSRQCWVCLGQGRNERADGGLSACTRCSGTGRCSFCRPAAPAARAEDADPAGLRPPAPTGDGRYHSVGGSASASAASANARLAAGTPA